VVGSEEERNLRRNEFRDDRDIHGKLIRSFPVAPAGLWRGLPGPDFSNSPKPGWQ
jgi:hypothetical protein